MSKDENVKQIKLRQQPFASPEKLHDIVAETYKLLKKSVATVQRSMALYLANRDTEIILFKPIKVKINASQSLYNKLHLDITQSCWVCIGSGVECFDQIKGLQVRASLAALCYVLEQDTLIPA